MLTDAVRVEILRSVGYTVDVIEFVDFAHSPKNIMLRAQLNGNNAADLNSVKSLKQKYKFNQALLNLVTKKDN